jgi:hypothetical protein
VRAGTTAPVRGLLKTGKEMRKRLNPETGPIVASADQVAKEANLTRERAEPQ